jgi:hypothetical protein
MLSEERAKHPVLGNMNEILRPSVAQNDMYGCSIKCRSFEIGDGGIAMRRGVVIIGVVFAVALAVAVGSRMSADAMSVVVGVACGVLASIPTSLVLLWALARRGPGADRAGQAGMGNYFPPVVVVNPGPGYGVPAYGSSPHALPAGGYPAASPALAAGPRSFKVVGDEETMLSELRHIFPGLADEWAETPSARPM